MYKYITCSNAKIFISFFKWSYVLFPGLERKEFDNKNVTFEDHIRREHNMWHYLYFIVLIKVKDPTEFTGPESYVHDMVKVCTGWTVNDGAFLCMCYVIMRNLDIFVTI